MKKERGGDFWFEFNNSINIDLIKKVGIKN